MPLFYAIAKTQECTDRILPIKLLSYLGHMGPKAREILVEKKVDIITLRFTPVLRTSIKRGR